MSKTPCSTIVGGKPCGDDLAGVEQITSADGTVAIVNPNGPIADLSAVGSRPDVQDNGVTQAVDPAFLNFVFSGSIVGAVGESPAGTAKIEIGGGGAALTNNPPKSTGNANSVGIGTAAARDDHKHDTGVTLLGQSVILGVYNSLDFIGTGVTAFPPVGGVGTVRIDATPPPASAQITQTGTPSTALVGPVAMPNTALIAVAAGTYLVNFSGSLLTDTINAECGVIIRAGGVLLSPSERSHKGLRANAETCFAIAGYRVTLAAPGDIEIWWGVSAGNVTAGPRNLSIVAVS